jgi:hypothetical protein
MMVACTSRSINVAEGVVSTRMGIKVRDYIGSFFARLTLLYCVAHVSSSAMKMHPQGSVLYQCS